MIADHRSLPGKGRDAARWVLAAIYFVAGIFHLVVPDPFLLITPDWVPFPRQVILLTGLCEVAGAAGLLTRRFRRAAGVALALYAVLVFPANIKHALDGLPAGEVHLGWWYHLPRLALQPVVVWWALFAGEVVDWPFRPRGRRAVGSVRLP
ncbi:DoxX family protein [Roseomonas sp. WA12]